MGGTAIASSMAMPRAASALRSPRARIAFRKQPPPQATMRDARCLRRAGDPLGQRRDQRGVEQRRAESGIRLVGQPREQRR